MTDLEELNVLTRHRAGFGQVRMDARRSDGKPRCQKTAYRASFREFVQCTRAGVVLAEADERAPGRAGGRLYYFCKQHSPDGVAKRDEEIRKRREVEAAASTRKFAREQATRAILAALKVDDIEGARAAYRKYAENDD